MQSGSILNRKLKSYFGRNNTSLDSEFEKEQSQLAALRSRTQSLGEQRRVALFGSTKEKVALQHKVNEDANFQLVIKEQRDKEQAEIERRQNDDGAVPLGHVRAGAGAGTAAQSPAPPSPRGKPPRSLGQSQRNPASEGGAGPQGL